jgi:hypothetical protein
VELTARMMERNGDRRVGVLRSEPDRRPGDVLQPDECIVALVTVELDLLDLAHTNLGRPEQLLDAVCVPLRHLEQFQRWTLDGRRHATVRLVERDVEMHREQLRVDPELGDELGRTAALDGDVQLLHLRVGVVGEELARGVGEPDVVRQALERADDVDAIDVRCARALGELDVELERLLVVDDVDRLRLAPAHGDFLELGHTDERFVRRGWVDRRVDGRLAGLGRPRLDGGIREDETVDLFRDPVGRPVGDEDLDLAELVALHVRGERLARVVERRGHVLRDIGHDGVDLVRTSVAERLVRQEVHRDRADLVRAVVGERAEGLGVAELDVGGQVEDRPIDRLRVGDDTDVERPGVVDEVEVEVVPPSAGQDLDAGQAQVGDVERVADLRAEELVGVRGRRRQRRARLEVREAHVRLTEYTGRRERGVALTVADEARRCRQLAEVGGHLCRPFTRLRRRHVDGCRIDGGRRRVIDRRPRECQVDRLRQLYEAGRHVRALTGRCVLVQVCEPELGCEVGVDVGFVGGAGEDVDDRVEGGRDGRELRGDLRRIGDRGSALLVCRTKDREVRSGPRGLGVQREPSRRGHDPRLEPIGRRRSACVVPEGDAVGRCRPARRKNGLHARRQVARRQLRDVHRERRRPAGRDGDHGDGDVRQQVAGDVHRRRDGEHRLDDTRRRAARPPTRVDLVLHLAEDVLDGFELWQIDVERDAGRRQRWVGSEPYVDRQCRRGARREGSRDHCGHDEAAPAQPSSHPCAP